MCGRHRAHLMGAGKGATAQEESHTDPLPGHTLKELPPKVTYTNASRDLHWPVSQWEFLYLNFNTVCNESRRAYVL